MTTKQHRLLQTQVLDDPSTAIYVRVSTIKESQKDSPEHQRMLAQEKCRMERLQVVSVYEDRDTGTSIQARPKIQQLLQDARNGCFKTIVFAAMSRFSRDHLDAVTLKRQLVNALGLRLISIEENYDSKVSDDEMLFSIISTVNQKLSEQISISARRGKRMSAMKGQFNGSLAPYGYQKIHISTGEKGSMKKTIEPHPEEAEVVRLIFDLYVNQNKGDKAITEYLNAEGYKSKKGIAWGITSVRQLLQNEVYIGNTVSGKYSVKKVYDDLYDMTKRRKLLVKTPKEDWARVEHTHEPLIDETIFQKAQEIRLLRGGGMRGGVRNRVNIFAGLVFCKECGAALVAQKSTGSNKKTYYHLICSTRRRKGMNGCHNRIYVPYEECMSGVLQLLSAKLSKIIDVDSVIDSITIEEHKRNEVELVKKQKDIEAKLEKARRYLFKLHRELSEDRNNIDREQLEYEREETEKEIRRYQNELGKIDPQLTPQDTQNSKEEIKTALEKMLDFKILEFDELHLLSKKIIKEIFIDDTGYVEVFTPIGLLE